MVYVRKSRRTYKKRNTKKSSTLNTRIARIAKTVALRQQETKHSILSFGVRQLYHNQTYNITSNLIDVVQGVNDTGHRIGDEITLRGIKVYLQMESVWDRPNTNFLVMIGKCRHSIAGGLVMPLKPITGVNIMDPVDTEQVMKVMAKRVYRFGDKNTFIDTTGGAPTANNARTTHFRTLWLPLNNVKYKFLNQNTNQGTAYNIAMWVGAYDASTELSTDNIGSIRVSGQLFFKDG